MRMDPQVFDELASFCQAHNVGICLDDELKYGGVLIMMRRKSDGLFVSRVIFSEVWRSILDELLDGMYRELSGEAAP